MVELAPTSLSDRMRQVASHPRQKRTVRTCAVCTVEFESVRSPYCSRSCQLKAQAARRDAREAAKRQTLQSLDVHAL